MNNIDLVNNKIVEIDKPGYFVYQQIQNIPTHKEDDTSSSISVVNKYHDEDEEDKLNQNDNFNVDTVVNHE